MLKRKRSVLDSFTSRLERYKYPETGMELRIKLYRFGFRYMKDMLKLYALPSQMEDIAEIDARLMKEIHAVAVTDDDYDRNFGRLFEAREEYSVQARKAWKRLDNKIEKGMKLKNLKVFGSSIKNLKTLQNFPKAEAGIENQQAEIEREHRERMARIEYAKKLEEERKTVKKAIGDMLREELDCEIPERLMERIEKMVDKNMNVAGYELGDYSAEDWICEFDAFTCNFNKEANLEALETFVR